MKGFIEVTSVYGKHKITINVNQIIAIEGSLITTSCLVTNSNENASVSRVVACLETYQQIKELIEKAKND